MPDAVNNLAYLKRDLTWAYLSCPSQETVTICLGRIKMLPKELREPLRAYLQKLQKRYPPDDNPKSMADTIADYQVTAAVAEIEGACRVQASREFQRTAKIVPTWGLDMKGQTFKSIESTLADYRANLDKGGSYVYDRQRGKKWVPWVDQMRADRRREIADIMEDCHYDLQRAIPALQKVAGRSKHWAETTARTEAMSINNEVHQTVYKQMGYQYVQIIAGRDERTCPVCAGEHGRVYPIEDAPHLPLHPNCRCTAVPWVPRDKEVRIK